MYVISYSLSEILCSALKLGMYVISEKRAQKSYKIIYILQCAVIVKL